jgi:hypothetical protein
VTRAAHASFALTVAALVGTAFAIVVVRAAFAAPAWGIDYPRAAGIAAALWESALYSGILAGGLFLAAEHGRGADGTGSSLWDRAAALWRLVVIMRVGSWIIDVPFDAPLMLVQGALIVGIGIGVWRAWGRTPLAFERALRAIWTAGALCIGVGMIGGAGIALFPTVFVAASDVARAAAWETLFAAWRTGIGVPVTVCALAFWQLHRISNVTPAWAGRGAAICAGMLALAGAWTTFPAFYPFGMGETARGIAQLGVVIAPIAAILVAAHAHRALADRNPSATLAGYWIALGIVLWLIGIGVIGALAAISDAFSRAPLATLGAAWNAPAAAAILLGMINHAVAQARGENRRITGLLPYWLITAGWIGGATAWTLISTADHLAQRAWGVPFAAAQIALAPLYALWGIAGGITAGGMVIYGLGFAVRRVILASNSHRGRT